MYEQEMENLNPFKFVSSDSSECDRLLFENFVAEYKAINKELWSNILPINKSYQELSDAYASVKKMANSYIDKDNNQTVSTLESKLSRYMT